MESGMESGLEITLEDLCMCGKLIPRYSNKIDDNYYKEICEYMDKYIKQFKTITDINDQKDFIHNRFKFFKLNFNISIDKSDYGYNNIITKLFNGKYKEYIHKKFKYD